MKSKVLSEETFKIPTTSDSHFTTKLTYIHISKITVKFEEIYLKQDKVASPHENVANFFIV